MIERFNAGISTFLKIQLSVSFVDFLQNVGKLWESPIFDRFSHIQVL